MYIRTKTERVSRTFGMGAMPSRYIPASVGSHGAGSSFRCSLQKQVEMTFVDFLNKGFLGTFEQCMYFTTHMQSSMVSCMYLDLRFTLDSLYCLCSQHLRP